MKIAVFHGTVLRVHPLFPLLLLLYLIAGQGAMIAAYLLALSLHEGGHLLVARRLQLPISQIELTPLGGSMQIDFADGLQGKKAFLLAAGGVCVNALCLLFCAFSPAGAAHSAFLVFFCTANAGMLAVNLLPILPLDGGRMLLSILSHFFDRARVFAILLLLGRLAACALLLTSAYYALRGAWRPLPAILGCYLLYAAALEEKHGVSRYLAAFFARRMKLERGQALPLQCLCAAPATMLYHLLPQLQPNAYHMVLVVDEDAHSLRGTVDESRLLQAAVNTPFIALEELLPQK